MFVSLLLTYVGMEHSVIYPITIAVSGLCFVYYLINYKKTFWYFLGIIPFLPAYFSVQFGSFPVITAFRVLLLLFIIDQLILKKRLAFLLNTMKKDRLAPIILFYTAVICSTSLVHLAMDKDFTSMIGAISIIVEKVLLYYLVLMNINIESNRNSAYLDKVLHTFCFSAFVLAVLGVIEYFTSFNVFSLLETSNSEAIRYSTYIRQGDLRVASSFLHSLGYGLYLLLIIPIVFYQLRKYMNNKKTIGFKYYVVLLFLLLTNLLLTSSRSTLIALAIGFIVYFIMTSLRNKIIIAYSAVFLCIPFLVFSITSYADDIPLVSSVGKNVKALSDTLLGTSLVEDYGKNSEPFTYREELVRYAFNQEGIDGVFGKGIGFIRNEPLIFYLPTINPYEATVSKSVDNYYVNAKLESGWIGLLVTIIFLLTVLLKIYKQRKKDFFYLVLFTSFAGYLIELTMVNELETMRYFWILLAVFSAFKKFQVNSNIK
ncbi:O-antigen ligase family protein [Paenibacillus sp. WC2504]|uniref:O-antigen ligase family protein n=1 Tax=Paenibacillus sp. WC2504 TaxID=3461403 RepID=UPI0040462543